MIRFLTLVPCLIVLLGSATLSAQETETKPAKKAANEKKAGKKAPRPLYRHVVLFQFKQEATKEQIAEIEKAFTELPSKIPEIVRYEWGQNISPEGLNDGLTHCFLVSFRDKAGLEVYIPHPAHKAFVAKLKPVLAKAVVVDFQAE